MAALPPVPKGVRLDFHLKQGDDPNIMVRDFYQYAGALSVADAVTWLAAITIGWNGVVALMSTTVTHLQIVLTDLTSNTAPQVTDTTTHVGTDAGAPNAAGTAFLLKKILARRYRGGHPRTYLPGMGSVRLQDPQTWNAASVANITAAYTTYVAAVIAGAPGAVGAVTHVNISYYSGFTNHLTTGGRAYSSPTPRVSPVVDAITGIVGLSAVASQRRRNETP
jgi:hypothetical protein